MIARIFKAVAWSALFGFVVGACTYGFAALINLMYGPVFYTTRGPIEHLGYALIYGLGGLVILGAGFLVSYAVWLRDRPAVAAILPLAVVAFVVQCLEFAAIEFLAIREANALSWPISDQLIPLNISIFSARGNWEAGPMPPSFGSLLRSSPSRSPRGGAGAGGRARAYSLVSATL